MLINKAKQNIRFFLMLFCTQFLIPFGFLSFCISIIILCLDLKVSLVDSRFLLVSSILFLIVSILGIIIANRNRSHFVSKSKSVSVFFALNLGLIVVINNNMFNLNNVEIINVIALFSLFISLLFLTIDNNPGEIENSSIKSTPGKTGDRNYMYYIILLGILSFGFIIRILNIATLPFNTDEGIYKILFNNFRNGSVFPALDSGAIYLRNFIYTYLSYSLDFFINNSLISIRLISLLFGTILLIVIFFFIKKITDKNTALLATLIAATNGFLINYSIQGRHYMMMYTLYLLLIYGIIFFDLKKRVSKIIVIVLAIILATNYEFIFLILPALLICFYFRRDKIYLGLFLLISILFITQPLITTKLLNYSPDILILKESKSVFDINFMDINFFENGIDRLIASLQPILYLIVLFFIINARRFVLYCKNNTYIHIFLSIFLTELIFYSFVLDKEQIRYKGSFLILSIIFLSIIFYIVTKNINQYKKVGYYTILILILIFIPLNINYPGTLKNPKIYKSNNFTQIINIFKDPFGSASINTNEIVSDYAYLQYIKPDVSDIILTTDLYNILNYTRIDYIFNPYLQYYYQYFSNGQYRSVYTSTPFINMDLVDQLIKNKKIVWLIADYRFKEQFTKKEQEFIFTNFYLYAETSPNYIGKINKSIKNTVSIYKSK